MSPEESPDILVGLLALLLKTLAKSLYGCSDNQVWYEFLLSENTLFVHISISLSRICTCASSVEAPLAPVNEYVYCVLAVSVKAQYVQIMVNSLPYA